jgi:hypothetical protein
MTLHFNNSQEHILCCVATRFLAAKRIEEGLYMLFAHYASPAPSKIQNDTLFCFIGAFLIS